MQSTDVASVVQAILLKGALHTFGIHLVLPKGNYSNDILLTGRLKHSRAVIEYNRALAYWN